MFDPVSGKHSLLSPVVGGNTYTKHAVIDSFLNDKTLLQLLTYNIDSYKLTDGFLDDLPGAVREHAVGPLTCVHIDGA